MDNKITKKRLSDFLSYEWIMMIIVTIAFIFLWEFVYTVGSVRLSIGQEFKYYYDQSISSTSDSNLYQNLLKQNTFSYDVLKMGSESLNEEYNVLSVRLSIQEGDIIFSDNKEVPSEDNSPVEVRAKSLVDGHEIYSLDKLLKDAKEYLRVNYFADGLAEDAVLDKANIDMLKLENTFRARMKKDNRFRKEEEILKGIELEKARIEKLCDDAIFFEKFLNEGQEKYGEDLFFRYTKYEQSLSFVDAKDRPTYEKMLEIEKQINGENSIYGIDMGKLSGGKNNASEFFKIRGEDTADNVIMMAFDFEKYQPHLQYESLSFICEMIKLCSDFNI